MPTTEEEFFTRAQDHPPPPSQWPRTLLIALPTIVFIFAAAKFFSHSSPAPFQAAPAAALASPQPAAQTPPAPAPEPDPGLAPAEEKTLRKELLQKLIDQDIGYARHNMAVKNDKFDDEVTYEELLGYFHVDSAALYLKYFSHRQFNSQSPMPRREKAEFYNGMLKSLITASQELDTVPSKLTKDQIHAATYGYVDGRIAATPRQTLPLE